jgi:hypothetical protein
MHTNANISDEHRAELEELEKRVNEVVTAQGGLIYQSQMISLMCGASVEIVLREPYIVHWPDFEPLNGQCDSINFI